VRSLGPLLDSIVTSLNYASHSRWGLKPDGTQVRRVVLEFLDWMKESGEWTQIEKSWKEWEGPWSLPLSLSRSFVRFRARNDDHKRQTRSESSARGYLDLPAPMQASVNSLTEEVWDAFSSMAHSLPEGIRLSYQLHLEGLLIDEIANLTGHPVDTVTQHVAEAKAFLGGEFKKRVA